MRDDEPGSSENIPRPRREAAKRADELIKGIVTKLPRFNKSTNFSHRKRRSELPVGLKVIVKDEPQKQKSMPMVQESRRTDSSPIDSDNDANDDNNLPTDTSNFPANERSSPARDVERPAQRRDNAQSGAQTTNDSSRQLRDRVPKLEQANDRKPRETAKLCGKLNENSTTESKQQGEKATEEKRKDEAKTSRAILKEQEHVKNTADQKASPAQDAVNKPSTDPMRQKLASTRNKHDDLQVGVDQNQQGSMPDDTSGQPGSFENRPASDGVIAANDLTIGISNCQAIAPAGSAPLPKKAPTQRQDEAPIKPQIASKSSRETKNQEPPRPSINKIQNMALKSPKFAELPCRMAAFRPLDASTPITELQGHQDQSSTAGAVLDLDTSDSAEEVVEDKTEVVRDEVKDDSISSCSSASEGSLSSSCFDYDQLPDYGNLEPMPRVQGKKLLRGKKPLMGYIA